MYMCDGRNWEKLWGFSSRTGLKNDSRRDFIQLHIFLHVSCDMECDETFGNFQFYLIYLPTILYSKYHQQKLVFYSQNQMWPSIKTKILILNFAEPRLAYNDMYAYGTKQNTAKTKLTGNFEINKIKYLSLMLGLLLGK